MNTPYAMNGDGVLNVSFVTAKPATVITGVVYYTIDNKTVSLTNGTSGNIHWLVNYDKDRDQTQGKWKDKYYYTPIPTNETVLNGALKQLYGWELP